MSNINTGGAAFPMNWVKQEAPNLNVILEQRGMTLRDYFAAQALTGAQIWDAVLNGKNAQFIGGVDKLADVAYAVADAMLKERNK